MIEKMKSPLLYICAWFLLMQLVPSDPLSAQKKPGADRAGWWNFNNPENLLAPVPGFGLGLTLVGSHQLADGPAANDFAAKIGVGSYYKMQHQIPANGGGSFVNEYSLQIDFKIEYLNAWRCFFQTNPQNNNDGDCFINPYGNIGVAATGYSSYTVIPDEWYRLVISVKNGESYTYYLDGKLMLNATVQEIDGRFALDPFLLIFADEDGEDNDIIVSEIAIWDRKLSAQEVNALGGFGHNPGVSNDFMVYPFLQTLTSNSVYISWHDTASIITRIKYGTSQNPELSEYGTSELVSEGYRWHTVKLTGLQPKTKYYYQIESGSDTSAVCTFTTQPENNYTGHIRFLLFSDTQDDSAMTGHIVRSAVQKVKELYPGDISDNINVILHAGDIVGSGSSISQWTNQFMRPFKPLSAYIPFLSVAGNHEGEHYNYYTYMKYDDLSAFPSTHPLHEKAWLYRLPGTLFLGLNTNMTQSYGSVQRDWLDNTLETAENDTTIDFVFVFMHHPPVTELWGEGNTAWVEQEILPLLKKYSKVQQLSYGHTHAYERGVIESDALDPKGDFIISCVGGGGGARDRWGQYTNVNYPYIHVALDHYFYVLFDFDLANKSYTGTMYDLGNTDVPGTNTPGDSWHRKLLQPAPEKPTALPPTFSEKGSVILHASSFSGQDALMSSRFQISLKSNPTDEPLFDVTRNWQDIFGVDGSFMPINLNQEIDLSSIEVPSGVLPSGTTLSFRIKYRDQNRKWSGWSDELFFSITDTLGVHETENNDRPALTISPNPFKRETLIKYRLKKADSVSIMLYNAQGEVIKNIFAGVMPGGEHSICFLLGNLTSGIYFLRWMAGSDHETLKLMIEK